jgi:rhamnosyltransferase
LKPDTQIVATVVAYRPDIALLEQVLAAISPQVASVLLVVNDAGDWACALPDNVIVDRQKENVGLGAAYNVAVSWARQQNASHLLLLDQDSVAASGMVEKLRVALASDPQAAAAGPLWQDRRNGHDGFFVRLGRFRTHKYMPQKGETINVDFLISSGSLIPLDALSAIGDFDAGLFIEHVDTEWSLRARARGYRLLGVAAARLGHTIGEKVLNSSVLTGRRAFFYYPPERQYYLLRNSLILWRRPYAPWSWVLHDMRRTFLLMSYYALFLPPRLLRLRAMIRAIRDGSRARSCAAE